MGADFLVYRLIDIVVDNYYAIIERIDDKLEDMEERITLDVHGDHIGPRYSTLNVRCSGYAGRYYLCVRLLVVWNGVLTEWWPPRIRSISRMCTTILLSLPIV